MASHIGYQTIDLGSGVVAPGYVDFRPIVDPLPWPDVRGKRCLDVGTDDGFFAFELERRGAAEVVCVDVDDRLSPAYERFLTDRLGADHGAGTRFRFAADGGRSRVARERPSIDDLDVGGLGPFDVVVCSGLHHLQEPASVLRLLREACRGWLLSIEHIAVGLTVLHPRRPLVMLFASAEGWSLPNAAGHARMIETAGFDVARQRKGLVVPYGPASGSRRTTVRRMAKGVLQTIISGRTGLAHSAVLARPRPRDACAEGAGGSHARAEPEARASRRVASDTPRVSVAIATRQRASLLPRLLSALETQTMPVDEFEVVIADDGSTDDTPEILRRSLAETRLNLRVERRDRRGGPAVARNTAWRAARGPIIAWTDDDCIPSPQWLDAGVRAMGNGRAIVIGKTLPNPDQQHRRGPFSHTMSATRWELARYLSTCNIFYRRDDLEAVGGFDERFTTGEDTDVGMRVSKEGAEIVFCSDALVHHDVTVSRFRSALRSAGRWTDLPLVARKHPEARRLLYEGLFWRGAHKKALLGALGIVAGVVLAFYAPVAFVVLPLLLVVPWVRHRIRIDPLCEGPCRWAVLPAAFVIDLLETLTLVRGSIRHRSLLL